MPKEPMTQLVSMRIVQGLLALRDWWLDARNSDRNSFCNGYVMLHSSIACFAFFSKPATGTLERQFKTQSSPTQGPLKRP